jgi:hypothetical protein
VPDFSLPRYAGSGQVAASPSAFAARAADGKFIIGTKDHLKRRVPCLACGVRSPAGDVVAPDLGDSELRHG